MQQLSSSPSSEKPGAPRPADFLLLFKPTLQEKCLAALILIVVIVCSRWSAIVHLNSQYLGGAQRDAGLYIWLVKSNLRDLWSLPWFNTAAFYPYTQTLAWSDNFILPSFLVKVLMLGGIGFTAAYNGMLLFASFLNGYATWRLGFLLGGTRAAAYTAGISFMSLAWFQGNAGHPQLQFMFWAPLALQALFLFIQTRRAWAAFGMGLAVSGAFFCAVYYAIFCGILLAVAAGAVLLQKPQALQARDYVLAAAGAALGLLPVIPCLAPYLAVREAFGSRALYEAHYFSATALSYITAAAESFWYSWSSSFSHEEARLFPGLLVFLGLVLAYVRILGTRSLQTSSVVFLSALVGTALFSLDQMHLVPQLAGPLPNYLCALFSWLALGALVWILLRLGRIERRLNFLILTDRGILAVFLFGVFAFFIFSLGPQGNPEKGHHALGVMRLLYEAVPGMSALRAVSRIGIVSLFCATMVLGLVISHFSKTTAAGKKFWALIPLLVFTENVVLRYPLEPAPQAPPILKELQRYAQPDQAAVMLPLTAALESGQVKSWGDFAEKNVTYMLWAQEQAVPIVNGYSGQRSKLMREWPAKMAHFPDARSLQVLSQAAGLHFVLYFSRWDPEFVRSEFLARIAEQSEQLRLLSEDSEGNFLFELKPVERLLPIKNVLVPSFPARVLELQLLLKPGSVPLSASVQILAESEIPGLPLAELKVDGDGAWHQYRISLPVTGEKVRPLRLSVVSDSLVYWRDLKVSLSGEGEPWSK